MESIKRRFRSRPRSDKVYVIDDDEAMRDSLDFLLDSAGFDVTCSITRRRFSSGFRRSSRLRRLGHPDARY